MTSNIDGGRLVGEDILSETAFALFGESDRKNVVHIKSQNAPIELIGAFPFEARDISPGGRITYVSDLTLGLLGLPYHWATSIPIETSLESGVKGRLVLVWEGLAQDKDRYKVKTVLDRSAMDISSAIVNSDLSRLVMSASVVIAECRRAHKRNRLIQVLVWFGLALLATAVIWGGVAR